MVIVVKKVEEPPSLEPEETDESSHRLKRTQLEAVGMYCFLFFSPIAMPVGKGIYISWTHNFCFKSGFSMWTYKCVQWTICLMPSLAYFFCVLLLDEMHRFGGSSLS